MNPPPTDTTPKPPISLDDERKKRRGVLNALPTKGYEEGCNHWNCGTLIDFKKRIVKCKKCKRELDPYAVIDNIAHYGDKWIAARNELAQAKKDAAFWNAEAKKAKARFNQATRKLPTSQRESTRRDAQGRMYLNRQKP